MTSFDSIEVAIDAHSRSALATTKQNIRYLYDPKSAGPGSVSSRRTRAALRVLRSSLIFIFWRIVRYAKYVAIGSLIATVSAGALGTVVSGAGFVLAPTGIAGTIVAGTVWGVGKFAVGRVKKRWEHGQGYSELDEERDEKVGGVRGEYRGPESLPW
ncbi:hypothetical protein BDV96DRAFT_611339 [Lophiotrema nucula]|uniref:Uncharacterized protein n=1 Tax=Lophiotrema nucula TaxID=690887 RepID=A0A6A5ZED5_9PLEO|nr:hypothetical protein BDV96DRAFT_611339 [Lophiotrema nucula]